MKETTNYKLKKYEDADYADPSQAMNPNMDAIDAALKALEDGKASLGEDGTIPAEQLPDLDYEPPLKDNAAKATPADGDSLPLVDSADGGKTKRVLWSRIKAVLKTYFDPIYAAAAHSHAWSTITGKPSSFTPALHASTHGSSGADPITPSAIGAAASAHKHGAGDINSGTLDAARLPTVPVNKGGTGKTSWSANRLIYPSAATTLAQLAFPPVAGSVLRQGTSGAPYWTSLQDLVAALGDAGGVRIATGSYTGTGTYGASNPCSLTFQFSPKIVVLQVKHQYAYTMIFVRPNIYVVPTYASGSGYTNNVTWNDTGLSWYSTDKASEQFNNSDTTYYYIAIG